MPALLDWAEAMWTGATTADHTSIMMAGMGTPLTEVAPGVGFLVNFANVIAIDGGADGLCLVDTGSFLTADRVAAEVGRWRAQPVVAAVYTHGHVDHAMGMAGFDAAAVAAGRPRPRVYAHEAVAARFERYRLTAGWNRRSTPDSSRCPGCAGRPSIATRRHLPRSAGSSTSARSSSSCTTHLGETDDHTWCGCRDEACLCTGDLFIWAAPNCGNPQKVQRYVREWADALDAMRALGAEVLAARPRPADRRRRPGRDRRWPTPPRSCARSTIRPWR
jgi:hypothetical protein